MNSDVHSVLAVTKDQKISSLISLLLVQPVFDLKIVQNINEARLCSSEKFYSIIIIDSSDIEASDFAIDISNSSSVVMVLVPSENFDQISYRMEPYGILTMSVPFDQVYFYNMMEAAIAVSYKIRFFTNQTIKLKEKMEEIRLINRAKMLLMQNLSMTEDNAHKYIEKEAMNRCVKKIAIAEEVIKSYG